MFDPFFTADAAWFGVPALFGTAIFLIRLALMFVGGDGDMAVDDGGGVDGFDGVDDGGDSDQAFELLSLQSIAAFAMGFGWAGLGSLHGAGWSTGTALAVGALGGVAMVWLLALLLRGVHDLQSSGTVNTKRAVGTTGKVYATVPEGRSGTGKVRVAIDNRERILDAVTYDAALPTGAQVLVLAVDERNTLTVTSPDGSKS